MAKEKASSGPAATTSPPVAPSDKKPDTIGADPVKISVELSTRFLEHFSEQLYSSPQKAFEELISNGWDAGADYVDVRIATDLAAPGATLAVLDNGSSMDEAGLKALWHIASSPKKNMTHLHGRPVIGKFGIGKLATYVLANKLTYICRAADGVIRRVTMDYAALSHNKATDPDKLIRDVDLNIYKVGEADVYEALKNVSGGAELTDLIKKGIPSPKRPEFEDEFGGEKAKLVPPAAGTWTLVILSDLKQNGKDLKIGVLRRMLSSALPIGSELIIAINGDPLSSAKMETPVSEEWVIGPDLNLTEFEFEEEDDTAPPPAPGQDPVTKTTLIKITSQKKPYPCVELPNIGTVTGRVRLFQHQISKGKSEERGASNGFHVNVRGRVVNQSDPSFGEKNLSHGAWACVRITVRADGLNEFLTTSREQFREQRTLKLFRAFLRKLFNLVRSQYDSDVKAALPHGGDVLVQSLGVVSLNPLWNVVAQTRAGNAPVPGMFDEEGIADTDEKRKSWLHDTSENIKTALNEIRFERLEDDSFVKFRLSDNSIVINKDHPFVEEHSRTKAEKELLRTMGMVSLLTDVYSIDIGVGSSKLQSIREYRDKLMRFKAMQRRWSGLHIAKLLLQMQHDSSTYKKLEACVSDALRYLGFEVKDMAKPGEPEGVAYAFPTPTRTSPNEDDAAPPLYKFTFDAKSTGGAKAQTNNLGLDGIHEHMKREGADYALVIAPGYQHGAVEVRCKQQGITPITARDLGKLLEYTVEHGAIPVTELRNMFSLYTPDGVHEWVEALGAKLKSKRPLTLDIFIRALAHLKGKIPDVLSASLVAHICREQFKKKTVVDADVIALVKGLSILVPDIIGLMDNDKIIVNASSEKVAEAVRSQLEKLHSELPLDADGEVAE
ncbi:MAG: ATP-binding protein [Armatimonadaceae bacterium]